MSKNLFIDDYIKSWAEDEILPKFEKNGVDLNNPEFTSNPFFQENKDETWSLNWNVKITNENILKKYFITDNVYENLYSYYGLGYKVASDSDIRYTLENLYRYIEFNNALSQKKNMDVYSYFERNRYGGNADGKNGLIRRLFNWGIDINSYDNSSKCKLLFYLFRVEHSQLYLNQIELKNLFSKQTDPGKSIRVFEMLNNPTLENVDNSFTETITRNGELIKKMKEDMFLEVPLENMIYYNSTIITIIYKLEEIITKTIHKYLSSSDVDIETLHKTINDFPSVDELFQISSQAVNEKLDLFDLFYLKLLQHENISRENDIIDLQSINFTENQINTQNFLNMKEDRQIPKDNAKQHFENNKNDLAKWVFQKDKVEKNEYQKYSKAVEMIDGIIDVLSINTKLLHNPTISENLLIVALQCYINIDKKTQVDNHFYGYKTSDQKSLHSEMKWGIQAFKKNQLAIVKYIYDTYYSKCGKRIIRNALYIFENYVDNFIKSLMCCSSVNQMLHMYFNSIWHIRSILYTNYHITNCFDYINNNLLYNYVINIDKSILQRFIAILDTGNVLINFINNLNLLLISSVFSKTEEISIWDDELGTTSVYEYFIEICFVSKRISIRGLKLNRIEKN